MEESILQIGMDEFTLQVEIEALTLQSLQVEMEDFILRVEMVAVSIENDYINMRNIFVLLQY